ncbi:hypothetical protein D6851_09945 [Altericroceibacterium spongiae]|uniref:Uncharacterized protein n=2 Tax=Altericroceibacterium spongiae TaxID=2320269 RepID=A0A420EKK1_9SPHN|nr:hypothetical protein D6851_09945 [Altericroceibacterium spongiae]
MTWNMRSGFNVAALNCNELQYQPILKAYSKMLEDHKKRLSSTNRALDAQYREKYGRSYKSEREDYMTKVYNYFALPPAHKYFCEAALAAANNYLLMEPDDIDSYAATTLVQFEAAFEEFYTDYENYRVAVQSWDARYGAEYGASQPGYVSADILSGDKGQEAASSGAAAPVREGSLTPVVGAQFMTSSPVTGSIVSAIEAGKGTSSGGR